MRRLVCSTVLTLAVVSGIALASADALADPATVLEARQALEHAEFGDAAAALSKLESMPEKGEVPLLRAELLLRTGKLEEAQKEADKAAKQKGAKPAAFALKAQALFAQGKTAEAIEALREVEGDEKARRARLLLGEYLIATGKRAEARAPLMTLIDDYNRQDDDPKAITSTDAEGLTMVGRAAHLLRNASNANDAYKEAEAASGKRKTASARG